MKRPRPLSSLASAPVLPFFRAILLTLFGCKGSKKAPSTIHASTQDGLSNKSGLSKKTWTAP